MNVMYCLADNDGVCRLTELLHQTALPKQTLNSALRKLESDGILLSEPENGKSKRIRLTEKGKSLAEETAGRVLRAENEIYSSWTKEEWSLYIELSERYMRELREKMKEI